MRKILLYLIISLFLSVIFFLGGGVSLDKLSLEYIQKTGAYPYIVFSLCILMLYIKRDRISAKMQKTTTPLYSVIGLSLAGLSLFLRYDEPSFQAFSLFLIWVGIFAALFAEAALIPLYLLGVYGFALVFPSFLASTGNFFPIATTSVLMSVLRPFIAIENQGTLIHFMDISGGRQTYLIDAACSGSASLSIFLSIFFIMMLDTPLSWKKGAYMLAFGLIGTSLQNILRLIILVFAGYWHGSGALWTAHTYAGYVLFPIWYILFAYVYFRQSISSNYVNE